MIRRFILLILLAGSLAALTAAVRTVFTTSRQPDAVEISVRPVDLEQVAAKLSAAIRIPTVTYDDSSRADTAAFRRMHALLEASFPGVHAALRRETVGDYSLLYTWTGSDPSQSPVLLTGHLDVVPVLPETASDWTHPPFEGVVADGYVWGRGAIDDKASVVSILESVEGLVADGFRPRRTVYLAFGHDEERGGLHGAGLVAEKLKKDGVRPALVLDEGLYVTEDLVPGVSEPVALVGAAEKGGVSLELSVETAGGHASMPPRHTTLGLLSRAVTRLEDHPFPARLEGVTGTMFEYVAPEMQLWPRLAFVNLWLFGPLVRRRLAAVPSTDAAMRTTTAPTIMEGGSKVNVLPERARAVLNFRILPGDDVSGVVERVRRTVNDDRVTIRTLEGASEPSLTSPVEAPAFTLLQSVIRGAFPGVIVAPALMIARTDARHYTELTDHVFRFSPVWMRTRDLERIHGVDERLALENLAQSVRFYDTFIRTLSTSNF